MDAHRLLRNRRGKLVATGPQIGIPHFDIHDVRSWLKREHSSVRFVAIDDGNRLINLGIDLNPHYSFRDGISHLKMVPDSKRLTKLDFIDLLSIFIENF